MLLTVKGCLYFEGKKGDSIKSHVITVHVKQLVTFFVKLARCITVKRRMWSMLIVISNKP